MRDDTPERAADELACLALLYASGELDESEAVAFERRLAEDQAVRDALCQAVEMNLTLTGAAPAAPDPAYRQRVRQRLQQRRRHLHKLAGQTAFFGHPALWSALGAAATVLLLVVLHHLALFPSVRSPIPSARQTQPAMPLATQHGELQRQLTEAAAEADALVREIAEAATPAEKQRKEERLHALAQRMIDLETQLFRVEVRQLEQALSERTAHKEQMAQRQFEKLLEKARKIKP